MRRRAPWLVGLTGCFVLAVGWSIVDYPDSVQAAKPPKEEFFFAVTIPSVDVFGVPTDIYIPGGPIVMEGILVKGQLNTITQLEGPGSLTFPTDGEMGNGHGDIGDVLVLRNEEDCDGDGSKL